MLEGPLHGPSWAGQRQREFWGLEGLGLREGPEEAIPFPGVLGYWGVSVGQGEESPACPVEAPRYCSR